MTRLLACLALFIPTALAGQTVPVEAQVREKALPVRATYPGCEDRQAAAELARAYQAETSEAYYSLAKRRMLSGVCLTISRGRIVEVVAIAPEDSLGVVRVRLVDRRKGEPDTVWIGREALREPSG